MDHPAQSGYLVDGRVTFPKTMCYCSARPKTLRAHGADVSEVLNLMGWWQIEARQSSLGEPTKELQQTADVELKGCLECLCAI